MDVLGAGAGQLPAAAAPPGAVVVPVAVAATQPAGAAQPAPNWTKLRLRWVQALVVLGFAAAALAMFAISPTGVCDPTAAEAVALRAAAKDLLAAAAAQVFGATTAVVVPVRPAALFATLLGWLTGFRAPRVLLLLVACDGRVDVVLAIYYWLFVVAMWVAYLVGVVVSSIAG